MTFDFPRMVRAWLAEDAAGRDVTPRGLFGPSARVRAVIVVRARGVLAGCLPAGAVFRAADARCAIRWLVRDGRSVRAGQPVASIIGPVRAVLACERTALNVLSRLSGIATLTARYVRAAAPVPSRIDPPVILRSNMLSPNSVGRARQQTARRLAVAEEKPGGPS